VKTRILLRRDAIRSSADGDGAPTGVYVRTCSSSSPEVAAHQSQVRQHEHRRAVLRQAVVARRDVANLPLGHRERMLHLRPDARLDALGLVSPGVRLAHRCWAIWLARAFASPQQLTRPTTRAASPCVPRGHTVAPHVDRNTTREGSSAGDGLTQRHSGYGLSQRMRKCIEQCLGLGKLIGVMRKVMVRGLDTVDQPLTMTMTVDNLSVVRTLVQ